MKILSGLVALTVIGISGAAFSQNAQMPSVRLKIEVVGTGGASANPSLSRLGVSMRLPDAHS